MNLRVFKKDIEFFVGEFIDDCALFIALNPHKDADEISDIVDEAVDLYNDLKQRANHPEGNKKAFYNGLTKEMFEKLDNLCEKLSAAWLHYKENKTFFKYDTSACRLSVMIPDATAARMGTALRELQVSDNPKCGCRAAELFVFPSA